ncbi:MAG: ABC transporter permease [Leptospiraceae bacterium]|nr:ABC transporter permease [Leptospiraceae bacterium]
MNQVKTSIYSLIISIHKNKNLIYQMTRRSLESKYKGSILGFFWSLVNPLLMLTVYTFAFSVVFKSKWGLEQEGHFDFALILFASLIVFNIFGESVKESSIIITNNASYVKKVIFPLELLPIINLLSTLVNAGTSLIIMIVMFLLLRHEIPFTIVFFPLVVIPLIFISTGISYLLASLGVFIRDIGQVVSHIVTILLFTSPIFFSIDRVPELFKKFIFLNPIGLLVEEARKVLVFGKHPDWIILGIYTIAGYLVLSIGYFVFQKLRKGFADVL